MKDASKVADEKTKDALAGMPAEPQDIPRSDRLKIELSDVQFEYDIIKGGMPELFPVFKNLKFTATQGQIIGVKGKSGSGRKTFLDLVSGTLYPTGGNIFVPLHLRKLLITPEIYLLDLSIWANLTFGSTEVDPYRLEKILKHFEMDAVLNDEQFQRDLTSRKVAFDSQGAVMVVELEEVSKTTNVLVKFREGYQALIHLIRGFLTNPEVMVMHRPFVHFHEGPIMEQVEEAIMETKEDRGFMMPEENVLSRRPRTIIMSLDNADTHESMTDVTWYLPDQIGGECVQKDAAARKGVGGFIPGSHLVLSSSQRGSKTAQARKAAADAQAPGSLQSLHGTVTSFVPASLMI
jgi:ABC-type branched-subunit amino acid transport system ATPase component